MKTEYEVRVLEINVEELKKKLDRLATFKFDRLQKRYVYDFKPVIPTKWLRLRTNGVDNTLTIKNILSDKIDGTKELEIKVSDFEETNLILKELGYIPKGYQENKRVQYMLDGVEIDIDYWPLIPAYMEIEGSSEEEVYKTLTKLGYSKKDATTKDVESIYLDYKISLKEIYNLKLEENRK
jgi:adenylate cyclase class 2